MKRTWEFRPLPSAFLWVWDQIGTENYRLWRKALVRVTVRNPRKKSEERCSSSPAARQVSHRHGLGVQVNISLNQTKTQPACRSQSGVPLQPPHPHQMYSTSRRHGSEGDRPCQSLANVSARVLARHGGKAGCPRRYREGGKLPAQRPHQ